MSTDDAIRSQLGIIRSACDAIEGLLAPQATVWHVTNAQTLQAAINQAQPGDVIRCDPTGTYAAKIILRTKTGSTAYITIRPDVDDSALPPVGDYLLDPHAFDAYEDAFATITPPANEYGILAEPGACYYSLIGLRITSPGQQGTGIGLGDWDPMPTAEAGRPHHIRVDRCWIDGQGVAKRGIAANGNVLAISNCLIDRIVHLTQDSQAISCTQGSNLSVVGCYLRASGETFIVGGDDPKIPNFVPHDISFVQNYCGKDVAWRNGRSGDFKNLFELKNARKVRAVRNIFEHCWAAGQDGCAILFTTRNQGGKAPWSTIDDVEFDHNIIRHAASALNVLGTDDAHPSGRLTNVRVHHNLAYDIGNKDYNPPMADGSRDSTYGIQISDGTIELQIMSNTITGPYSTMLKLSPGKTKTPNAHLQISSNVLNEGKYSIATDGLAAGGASWAPSVVDAVSTFIGNGLIRTAADNYKYPQPNTKTAQNAPALDAGYKVLPDFKALAGDVGVDPVSLPPIPL